MPATHKMVNGVDVPYTAAEAAVIEAEWEANAPGTGAAWQADQSAALQQLRTAAKNVVAASDGDPQALAKAVRALALIILDQTHNALAAKVNAILAALDAGTYAQARTAAQGIADAPTYTAAQLKTAIRNRIDSGDADA